VSRVLVVDDEDAIREAIAYSLAAEGLDVEAVSDGSAALAAIESDAFDLVILDVMLDGLSGVEVARRARVRSRVPILLLTARDSEADVVLGFEAGADDYVTKPFSMRELVSRVRAILRRRELDRTGEIRFLRAGDVELDLLRREVSVAGAPVHLTPTEFQLLRILASEDRAFTRHELLSGAWNTPVVPDDRSCDVHIANLRRKIETDPAQPGRVLTVRSVGYRLART
jgi:two-component system, OmpR family, response regulator RegX3